MKINEFTGIYHMVDALDPDTIRAQRLAELADIAEWRARHLQQIKDWSDTEKREARIKQAEADARAAREMVAADPERFAEGFDRNDKLQLGKITEIQKPPPPQPKRSWISRLLGLK